MGWGFPRDGQSLRDLLEVVKDIGDVCGEEGITTLFPSENFGS